MSGVVPATRSGAIRSMFILWGVISVVPVVLLTLQTATGAYGEDSTAAWNWLLGQCMPVVSVLLSSVFSDHADDWAQGHPSMWRWGCATFFTLLQGACIWGALVLPFALGVSPFRFFDATAILLTFLQSVVVAAVGSIIFDGR